MSLVEHAESELRLAGLFDKNSDYEGMIAESVMELIKVFAAQGHSGCSAMLTLSAFNTCARFRPLTPITSDPSQWNEVGRGLWQSRRCASIFSRDGGETSYDIDMQTPESRLHVTLERVDNE